MEKMITNIDTENVILEKVSIIIDIMMLILNCSYSDAYEVITKSKTYSFLQQKDYCTLHDSPQANLSSIGKELRENNIDIGFRITDDNIKLAMIKMREQNLNKV